MRPWLLSTVLLCACAPTPLPRELIEPAAGEPGVGEPAKVELEAHRPAPSVDGRPLDPEIAELLTPEALEAAAAAAEPKPPAPDPRTPVERARDHCQSYCERPFDRDRLIRRLIESSWRAASGKSMEPPHGLPPDLEDEDGLRRFINGERSTVWWWSYVLYINPILDRVDFPFSGTLIEIDEHNNVLRCHYVDRDDPAEAIDMTCSARE
jgi:hypothetical protein